MTCANPWELFADRYNCDVTIFQPNSHDPKSRVTTYNTKEPKKDKKCYFFYGLQDKVFPLFVSSKKQVLHSRNYFESCVKVYVFQHGVRQYADVMLISVNATDKNDAQVLIRFYAYTERSQLTISI